MFRRPARSNKKSGSDAVITAGAVQLARVADADQHPQSSLQDGGVDSSDTNGGGGPNKRARGRPKGKSTAHGDLPQRETSSHRRTPTSTFLEWSQQPRQRDLPRLHPRPAKSPVARGRGRNGSPRERGICPPFLYLSLRQHLHPSRRLRYHQQVRIVHDLLQSGVIRRLPSRQTPVQRPLHLLEIFVQFFFCDCCDWPFFSADTSSPDVAADVPADVDVVPVVGAA